MDEVKIIRSPWAHFLARPSMYMGKKSIFGLQCMMMGIQMADGPTWHNTREDKFFEMKNAEEWDDFEKWVAKKTKNKKKYMYSFDIALHQVNGDDEKAFDVWAKWFQEWKEENGK